MRRGIWNFQPFLPNFKQIISLDEANTPLLPIKNMEHLAGLKLKLEFRNPTGSFRDRAAALIVSDALSKKHNSVIGASTGSYGISLAAYCGRANIHSTNVIPHNMELSKIEQLKLYGSDVIQHGNSLEDAQKKAIEILSEISGAYAPLPKQNLLTIEGQKTLGLELAILETPPERIFVPKGSGSLVLSIIKGLRDACGSDLIDSIPEIVAVSLEQTNTAYMIESLETSRQDELLFKEVEKQIQKYGGQTMVVPPEKLIANAELLAKKEGLFIEPASASVLYAAQGCSDLNSSVAVLSGSGHNALNIFARRIRKDLSSPRKVVWGISKNSTIKFEILNIISRWNSGSPNGVDVWKALDNKKSRQSIYQHLTQLEEKGLLKTAKRNKISKDYSLTRKGFEFIDKMRDIIDYF